MRHFHMKMLSALALVFSVTLAAPPAQALDVTGTMGVDELNGTDRPDRILGLAGDDQIWSLGGADFVGAGWGGDYDRSGSTFRLVEDPHS